jgi:hypothetical protein
MAPKRVTFDDDAVLTPPERLLKQLLAQNAGVRTVKGSGRVSLTQDNQTSALRAGWIGMAPDRIRVEVFTTTGQAVGSFASDGEYIYLLSPSDGQFIRKKASEGVLSRIISVKMSAEDFLDLISGRIPVHLDGDVRMETGEEDGDLLIIEGRERGCTDRIRLDTNGKEALEFERLDKRGALIFRATLNRDLEVDGTLMPRTISIENGEGDALNLRADQCWINPDIEADKFVLEKP